jgi:hypothetical protein
LTLTNKLTTLLITPKTIYKCFKTPTDIKVV